MTRVRLIIKLHLNISLEFIALTRLVLRGYSIINIALLTFNPKRCRLLGGVLFGEMKFVLSNFLSSEDLSISYKS